MRACSTPTSFGDASTTELLAAIHADRNEHKAVEDENERDIRECRSRLEAGISQTSDALALLCLITNWPIPQDLNITKRQAAAMARKLGGLNTYAVICYLVENGHVSNPLVQQIARTLHDPISQHDAIVAESTASPDAGSPD